MRQRERKKSYTRIPAPFSLSLFHHPKPREKRCMLEVERESGKGFSACDLMIHSIGFSFCQLFSLSLLFVFFLPLSIHPLHVLLSFSLSPLAYISPKSLWFQVLPKICSLQNFVRVKSVWAREREGWIERDRERPENTFCNFDKERGIEWKRENRPCNKRPQGFPPPYFSLTFLTDPERHFSPCIKKKKFGDRERGQG